METASNLFMKSKLKQLHLTRRKWSPGWMCGCLVTHDESSREEVVGELCIVSGKVVAGLTVCARAVLRCTVSRGRRVEQFASLRKQSVILTSLDLS